MAQVPALRSLTLALLGLALATAPASAAVRLQRVGGFSAPVWVAAAPGDYHRLYVVQKGGAIRVVKDGTALPGNFATIGVSGGTEQGLLSMAFRPDFQRSRLLYVYYTDPSGDVRVDELRATNPDRADVGYRKNVITIPHRAASNHNGGTIAFGPDGYLWLAPGDGGGGQSANAQNLNSRLGKVLRIAPRPGVGGATLPAGNPFPANRAVWAYGLRNPFRFSFDRLTGDLIIADVGEGTTEEVDFAPVRSGRGRGWNFGWNVCEGSFATGTTSPCTFAGSHLPVINQSHDDGWEAIIGGVVVRDPSLPSLYGRYLYGDNVQSELHSAALPNGSSDRGIGLHLSGLAGISEDAAGCVYAASLNGGVYRVVENSTRVPCPPPVGGTSSDRVAPRLRVRVPRRQRVRRNHGVVGYARSSETGTVSMSARLRIGHRTYRLRYTRRHTAAHRRVRLKARLTRRASRALRRALRHHRRARVRVALRARDRAGNRSRLARRTVRVRRR